MAYFLYPSFPARFFFFFNRPFYPIPQRVSRTRWHRANPPVIQFRNATSAGHFQAYWGWIVYPVAICFKPSFPYLSWSPSLRRGGGEEGHSPFPPLSFLSHPRDYRPTRGERISPATTFYSKWARRLVPARLGGGRKFTSFFDDKLSRKAQSNGVS